MSCFVRSTEGGVTVPVIVGKYRAPRAVAAHAVPHKGASIEWVVDQLKRDLHKWGLWDALQITVKCDNEYALMDLVAELAQARADGRIVIENSPTSESASNGMVEAAVKGIEGLVRTLWIGLQKRLQIHVGGDTPNLCMGG